MTGFLFLFQAENVELRIRCEEGITKKKRLNFEFENLTHVVRDRHKLKYLSKENVIRPQRHLVS